MSRDSRWSKPHGSWLGAVLVAVVVGGISYGVFSSESGVSITNGTQTTSTELSVMAKPKLLISVAGNEGPEIFRFDVERRTLDKVDGSALIEPASRLRIEPGEDGVFRLKDGEAWDVILRSASGQAYDQARVIGVLASAQAAVIAYADGPRLLVVERSGSIREAYRLPEAYTLHGIQSEAVWLATLQPGPGIESPPQGPSTILRIARDGAVQVVKTVDEALASLSIGPGGALAYGLETGEFQAESGSSTWEGTGRPLLWLDSERLLIVTNKTLKLINLIEAKQETLVELAGVPLKAVPEP